VKKISLLLVVLALSACVPQPARVDTPLTEDSGKSYKVDLPVGWIKQWTQGGVLIVSHDGPLLQTIMVSKAPLKEAFPKTKKAATEAALPAELAEMRIAELKATNEQLAALQVIENEPAIVAGKEGYRLKVAYKSQRGLRYERVIYGVVDKNSSYALDYFAPSLLYFERDLPTFQKVVESFQLASANAGGKAKP